MLAAALVLAGLGWHLASDERADWQRESVVDAGDAVLPDLAELEQRLRTIEFSDATQLRRVELDGETWTLADKDGYPAKQATVVGLFRAVGDLERVEAKTANPARHDRLGLIDPAQGGAARKVRFLDEAGEELAALLLGETYRGLANPALFVRAVNADQCWLVEGQVNTRTSDFDWLDRDLFALGSQRVARAVLQLPEGSYAASRETPDSYEFALEELPLGQKAKSAFLVSAVARLADNFRFQDVARSESLDLAKVTDESTAVLTTFGGLILKVAASRLGSETSAEVWVRLQASLDESVVSEENRAELESELLELNRKFDAWRFRLEATPATAMFRPLSELIEADTEAELPEGAAGPVLPGFSPNEPDDAIEAPAEDGR